jgi:nucleotidyltransferase substrate binding protein (TIGR01987 family)
MNPLRWKQRFDNFERALALLQEGARRPLKSLSDLEKEGLVQRFEYTFELAWKTTKDYLEFSGVTLDQDTARCVIKQAFAARIIADGQLWIDMLEHRNVMAHAYDRERFEAAVGAIRERYVGALAELHVFLRFKALAP